MEEKIKNHLIHALLSLVPARHRRNRVLRTRSGSTARRVTRIQTGMPAPRSTAVGGTPARSRAPRHGYGRSHYLPTPLRDARGGQRMFRIT